MKRYATMLTAILVLSGAVGAQAAGAPAAAKSAGQGKLVLPKGKTLSNGQLSKAEGKVAPLVGYAISGAVQGTIAYVAGQKFTGEKVTVGGVVASAGVGAITGPVTGLRTVAAKTAAESYRRTANPNTVEAISKAWGATTAVPSGMAGREAGKQYSK